MGVESLLDERGDPSRRWADLGLVRASDLPGRGSPRAVAHGSGRRPLRPVRPEPAGPPEPAGRPTPPVGEPPVPSEGAAVLPVVPALARLLPASGLRRGTTITVARSTALVLALLAEASRSGSWCALVGLPALGLAAAAEAGLDLARTALVPHPGPRPATVVAALVDGVDVVVLGDAGRWSAGDRQRLGARVRQRGAVLVPVGPAGVWPGADAELVAGGGTWEGLAGDGAGRLRSRRVQVRCAARGRPGESGVPVLLPGPTGACLDASPVEGADDPAPGRTTAWVAG